MIIFVISQLLIWGYIVNYNEFKFPEQMSQFEGTVLNSVQGSERLLNSKLGNVEERLEKVGGNVQSEIAKGNQGFKDKVEILDLELEKLLQYEKKLEGKLDQLEQKVDNIGAIEDNMSGKLLQLQTTENNAVSTELKLLEKLTSIETRMNKLEEILSTQGSKPQEQKKLKRVFLVPHSHCDAGWLKTFDEYYNDQVVHIIDTMIDALHKKPNRKFGWVEIGFLQKWWNSVSTDKQNLFRSLILDSKQLEIVMGGWVSNDEASVTYMQTINQMTHGHRFLQEHVSPEIIPRTGWQIDPFGLSKVTPALFSQMCFDSHVAWRIPQPTAMHYKDNSTLEFLWRGSESLGPASEVLMHVLLWSYTVTLSLIIMMMIIRKYLKFIIITL